MSRCDDEGIVIVFGHLAELGHDDAGQMADSYGMLKSGVRCAWEDIVRRPELF